MRWKLLIILLISATLGYATYTTATYYLTAPNTFTVEGALAYIASTTTNTVDAVTKYVQDKWQWITASIGSLITVCAVTYRTIKNKITTVQQTAETQVSAIQENATQQYVNMQGTITAQTQKITQLETQIAALQQQADKVEPLTQQLAAKEAEVQKLIGERNAADRIAAQTGALLKKCPSCNQNILPGQTYCQYCGKEIIIT